MALQDMISGIAPTIALALDGPFANGALKMLSTIFLGKENSSKEEIESVISEASSERLTILKEIDHKFKKDMGKLGIDLKAISTINQKSEEKKYDEEAKDWIASILGIFIVVGFFGIMIMLLFFTIPEPQKNVFNLMLGSLGTMSMGVISFYFGSSSGSKKK